MSSTNQSSNTSSNFSANSSSASHAAAEHTKKSLHEDSTHGTQHEARDKPEHESVNFFFFMNVVGQGR